jgi:hydrogenase-4 membrane subunit HyfE
VIFKFKFKFGGDFMLKNINKQKLIYTVIICVLLTLILGTTVFAEEDGVEEINKLANTISGVFQKIGLLVIFIGGIQVAWAMSSDNPDMKNQAFKIIAAGILVIAMSSGWKAIAG